MLLVQQKTYPGRLASYLYLTQINKSFLTA